MKTNKQYTLPSLPYNYNALEPYISEDQLRVHYDKHHASYVKGANSLFEKLENARREKKDLDMGSILKKLSFNVGGHILHSLFWENIDPKGGGEPSGKLLEMINEEFGNFDRFKEEFIRSTMAIEGSGWSALAYDTKTEKLLIMHMQLHNKDIYPTFPILMVLDFWEHAYYIDYKNEKEKFIDAFWNIVNWEEVNKRLENTMRV